MDIASMLEVEVQEVAESKENVTPKPQQTFPCQSYSSEENDFYKLTYGCDIASVRFLRLHCTACDEHIGSAPSEAHNMHEHPVLRVLLCAKCRQFYGDGTFEQGEDATDMFCRWCANGGNLYCCSYCSNTFCSKCIKRNFDFATIKRIEEEDTWKCFVCDPKDLYPLRSIARALIVHIETVTRILENNKRMSSREIEEKMHLDETKCCSRKRKRRRRRTLSGSDDDNDDDEDVNYVPEMERTSSPPAKKRRSRCGLVRNTCNSNGYLDHEYNAKRRSTVTKVESDYDPTELISQCEQTMIEGEDEIVNTNDTNNEENVNSQAEKTQPTTPQTSYRVILPSIKPKQPIQPLQLQPLQKIQLNNAMGTLNPVPIANLLKVPILGKKIKVTNRGPPKLVAVPVQGSVSGSGISFVKPTTHFLVPKSVSGTLTPIQICSKQTTSVVHPPPLQPIQTQPVEQQRQPSVIDLDSDDESIIVENVVGASQAKSKISLTNVNVINEGDAAGENVVPEPYEGNNDVSVERPLVFINQDRSTMPSKQTISTPTTKTTNNPEIIVDGVIPVKTQQRYKRFEKMLKLQSKEIDVVVGDLKTKMLKLVQTSIAKPSTSQDDGDLQNAAFVCTKRFHRALRKALIELSHINDRLVKDYLHWKKKTDKAERSNSVETIDVETLSVEDNDLDQIRKRWEKEQRENIPRHKRKTDDISLEMICERESASESENESDDDFPRLSKNHEISATDVPPDFSAILDHLSIFKRKPTAVKAVGNDSVLTEDKACQAYDVPWRDYEKCIGYSLLTRSDYDPEKKDEILRPVAQPDENFGKYQEQYLFYLQHVEDCGIETDETKGLPDPNHIPLKDLIDSSSPFIMDMLERLSPVTLSNGYTSPNVDKLNKNKSLNAYFSKDTVSDAASDCITDAHFPTECNKDSGSSSDTRDELLSDKRSEDNPVATSKAVQELQKMVTKLSEDLRHEQQHQLTSNESKESSETDKQNDLDKESLLAVNSILEISSRNVQENDEMDVVEIVDVEHVPSDNDDCMTLD